MKQYLEDLIPPKHRKKAYALFGLLGVLIGATFVGFAAAAVAVPTWLKVVAAVYAFVGGPVGAVANANTPSQTHEDAI